MPRCSRLRGALFGPRVAAAQPMPGLRAECEFEADCSRLRDELARGAATAVHAVMSMAGP